MLKRLVLKSSFITLTCIAISAQTIADERKQINVPAGDLIAALKTLAQQSGADLVYRSKQLEGLRTEGAAGTLSTEEAATKLLEGTDLTLKIDSSGAMLIALPRASGTQQTPAPASGQGAKDASAQSTAAMGESKRSFWDEFRSTQADREESASVSGGGGFADERHQTAGVEEIIVTATKRQERAQDIPISIAVINTQEIERRGVIGMEDYLRSIPGVTEIDSGPLSNAIIIRGITTSPEFENFTSGSTVGTYFDETPITGAAGIQTGGIDVRPVDIERIEVLRGPQGTTFGSASLGGTLRIIPVKPKLEELSARLAASYSDTSGFGSENSMLQGVLNIPVVAGALALRAVGYRYDESGFYRNVAGTDPETIMLAESFGLGDFVRGHVQDDVGQIVTSGGRMAALWQPTDKLDLSMNFLTQKIEQDGQPLTTLGKHEQARFPVAPQARVRGEVGEINDTDIDLMNLVLNYDLGWAVLTTVGSWIDGGAASAFTGNAQFGLPSQSNESDFGSVTAEARLASRLGGRFQFLGGVFYEDVENDYFQTFDWPGASQANPFGTNPQASSARVRDLEQRAAFGEVSYELTDQVTATVGGRYFKYDKNEGSLDEGGLFGVPLGAGIAQVLDSDQDGSSLKASLSYKPRQDWLLYASWAEGFRLGRTDPGLPSGLCDADSDGFADDTGISIESTRTIKPDFLENYEIGTKLAFFERRLMVDAAVYRIEWQGLPTLTTLGGTSPCAEFDFTSNVGAATSTGVEFQGSVMVLKGLRLDFGAGYTKAELSKDAPALGVEDGARLPGSPEVNANLSAQYDFELAGYTAFVRADSFYAGEFFGDLLETPDTRAGDYVKVDARTGVAISNLSVELFVRNLTNEDAYTWRSSFGGYRLRPRTVGVQLGYRFE